MSRVEQGVEVALAGYGFTSDNSIGAPGGGRLLEQGRDAVGTGVVEVGKGGALHCHQPCCLQLQAASHSPLTTLPFATLPRPQP